MSGIVHRLSMVLALAAFGVCATISLAVGVSLLGVVLRATLGFVIVGAISRALLGTACATIARDLAENPAGVQPAKTKEK